MQSRVVEATSESKVLGFHVAQWYVESGFT
jgi:hypothetical protein